MLIVSNFLNCIIMSTQLAGHKVGGVGSNFDVERPFGTHCLKSYF